MARYGRSQPRQPLFLRNQAALVVVAALAAPIHVITTSRDDTAARQPQRRGSFTYLSASRTSAIPDRLATKIHVVSPESNLRPRRLGSALYLRALLSLDIADAKKSHQISIVSFRNPRRVERSTAIIFQHAPIGLVAAGKPAPQINVISLDEHALNARRERKYSIVFGRSTVTAVVPSKLAPQATIVSQALERARPQRTHLVVGRGPAVPPAPAIVAAPQIHVVSQAVRALRPGSVSRLVHKAQGRGHSLVPPASPKQINVFQVRFDKQRHQNAIIGRRINVRPEDASLPGAGPIIIPTSIYTCTDDPSPMLVDYIYFDPQSSDPPDAGDVVSPVPEPDPNPGCDQFTLVPDYTNPMIDSCFVGGVAPVEVPWTTISGGKSGSTSRCMSGIAYAVYETLFHPVTPPTAYPVSGIVRLTATVQMTVDLAHPIGMVVHAMTAAELGPWAQAPFGLGHVINGMPLGSDPSTGVGADPTVAGLQTVCTTFDAGDVTDWTDLRLLILLSASTGDCADTATCSVQDVTLEFNCQEAYEGECDP